jgi:hypothetical protein
LGFVLKKENQSWLGYAATADRQTYFRFAGEELELIEPDEALEDAAFAFASEWLWYDEEEAALERARYASYGFPVRGANLRAEKLALLRRTQGNRYSTLDAEGARVREALVEEWPKKA